jgi:hypothetical protein
MSKDLPPEAYTRETLQEAFNWLQDQPEPVRATIHTPERLVSLFRKSQRLNDLDAPVSSKQFIDDLKSLATSLNQFGSSSSQTEVSNNSFDFKNNNSATLNDSDITTTSHALGSQSEVETKSKKTSILMTQETKQKTTTTSLNLDPLTMERVQKIKERFNLSSDQEAVRLLVSLGFEKFSQFQ